MERFTPLKPELALAVYPEGGGFTQRVSQSEPFGKCAICECYSGLFVVSYTSPLRLLGALGISYALASKTIDL